MQQHAYFILDSTCNMQLLDMHASSGGGARAHVYVQDKILTSLYCRLRPDAGLQLKLVMGACTVLVVFHFYIWMGRKVMLPFNFTSTMRTCVLPLTDASIIIIFCLVPMEKTTRKR